jgi:hypothetical protein
MPPAAHESVPAMLHMQRVIGNQAIQRLLHANVEGLEKGSHSTPGFALNLRPLSAGVRALPDNRLGYNVTRVRAIHAGNASRPPAAFVSLSRLEAGESTISVTQPLSDDGKASAVPPAVQRKEDSCAVPFGMNKVTSGPFQGGYTMDDYLPSIRERGSGATLIRLARSIREKWLALTFSFMGRSPFHAGRSSFRWSRR